jgi:tRNA pseudouridine38-40 synthase
MSEEEDEDLIPEEESQAEENMVLRPRYFMHISYDGTNYHGWQVQPNGNTVQAEIESALRKLLRQNPIITLGCGRTDAGVHARNFYLHLTPRDEIENLGEIFFKLNMMLPWDIAVHAIFRVHDMAHSRFDANERSYEYHIHQRRDPFIQNFSTYYPWLLDVDKMNQAAAILLKYKDFAAFSKTRGGQKTTICDLRKAYWVKNEHKLVFHITANRFLRNMVRAIVGTLIEVGKGRITIEEFETIIQSGDRKIAGDSAKARGLTLTEVKYPYELPPNLTAHLL